MMFSNKVYDVLKWVAMIFLPALSALYFALSAVWGLPYAEQVVGTIAAVTAFLGVLLGISSAQYQSSMIKSEPTYDWVVKEIQNPNINVEKGTGKPQNRTKQKTD